MNAARPQGHVAQLFGRDSLYLLMWAVQIGCAAVLTPITTRLLGLTEFGTVTSANAVMQVLWVFAGLGLQTAIQREYATHGNPRGARRLVFAAVVLTAGVSALAWATVGLWAGALGMGDATAALRLAVLWAGTSALTTISLALLRSEDRLAMFSTVSFIQSVIAEALALGLAKFYRPTAEMFLTGQVAAQVAAAFLGLLAAPPVILLWREREVVARALRFALPLVPTALSTFVLSTSDRLIIEAHLGSEAVARYQVAYNVASMPMLLLTILNSVWMPRFFGIADEGERRQVLASSRDALYRLLVPIVIGFACGAPLVLRVWAPASYHPEQLHLVVCVVLVTAIPYAGQLAVARTLMSGGRTGVTAVGTAAAAVVNVILNLMLVPRYGLTGSAFATLAAYVYLAVVLAVVSRGTRMPAPPFGLRLWLAGAAGVALFSAAVAETPLTLVLRAVACAGTVAWFVRVLLRIGKEPEPAEPEPAEREPAEREPAEREPAEREPAEREPAEPEPAVVWNGPTVEMSAIYPDRRVRDRRQAADDWQSRNRADDRRRTESPGQHRPGVHRQVSRLGG
jgi:O-antigen/teichoic acid export membrane protein